MSSYKSLLRAMDDGLRVTFNNQTGQATPTDELVCVGVVTSDTGLVEVHFAHWSQMPADYMLTDADFIVRAGPRPFRESNDPAIYEVNDDGESYYDEVETIEIVAED